MLQPHPFWTHLEVLNEVHFMNTICHFKAWEVRSPALQAVHDLELKQRSYGYLKTTVHTMSENVVAAPPFRQLLDTIRSLPEVQIIHAISSFKAWEVRSP